MSGSKTFKAVRFEAGVRHAAEDQLTLEAPLQITINGKPFSVTMRTPGDDLFLVKGLLFTERIAQDADGAYTLTEIHDETSARVATVNVSIPEVYLCKDVFARRSLLASSSCGMCGQREFDPKELNDPPLKPAARLRVDAIPGIMRRMREAQKVFETTGSTHAAAAFTLEGELIALYEDIGRHNAVDKVVGFLLETGRLAAARVLAVSGRVSIEIVHKTYHAGIPFLLAVSAPSSLAVETAERWGMTLLGYCRERRATAYSNPQQVA